MVERYFVGRDPATGTFKLRVSKPGHEARSAAIENLLLHENMNNLSAAIMGSVSLPAGQQSSGQRVDPSFTTLSLGRSYTTMPKIILRCNLDYLPSYFSYFCSLQLNTGQLTLYNRTLTAMTIKYAIFAPI